MTNQVERKWCRSLTIMEYQNFLQFLIKLIKYVYLMLCLISDIRKDLLFPPLCHTYFCFPSWQPGQWTCPVGKNGNCYQFEQIRLPITSVQFSFVIIQGSHPKGSKNYDLPHSPKTWIVIQRKKPLTLLRTHLVIFSFVWIVPYHQSWYLWNGT